VERYNLRDRPVTAVHEAAHAIVGSAIGWPVDLIDLEATGSQLGAVTFIGHGSRLDNDDPMDAATVDLAGHVAERMRAGETNLTAIVDLVLGPWTGDKDAYAACKRAWEACNDEEHHRPFIEQAVDRAESILRAHWPAVEALAAALLERGQLTGADVDTILSDNAETTPTRTAQPGC
jgi:ATP-dependent Zn protease